MRAMSEPLSVVSWLNLCRGVSVVSVGDRFFRINNDNQMCSGSVGVWTENPLPLRRLLFKIILWNNEKEKPSNFLRNILSRNWNWCNVLLCVQFCWLFLVVFKLVVTVICVIDKFFKLMSIDSIVCYHNCEKRKIFRQFESKKHFSKKEKTREKTFEKIFFIFICINFPIKMLFRSIFKQKSLLSLKFWREKNIGDEINLRRK